MSNHFFLVDSKAVPPVTPTGRWLEAFPGGRAVDADSLRQARAETDVVWLSTTPLNWPQMLKRAATELPGSPVVVVSNAPDPEEGLKALDAGARGYCHAYAVPGLFADVAQVVLQGGLWVGPDLMGRLVVAAQKLLKPGAPEGGSPNMDLSMLSAREAEVAWAVAAGRSNREVAEQLFISERTVKAHLGVVFDKLGIRDRVQLVLRLSGKEAGKATL